ncbi:MAG: BadF/BadG/BcrA/BcrD ATPase family protein [Rhizobiaceae bacterium]
MGFVIGVDGGGTGCRAALATGDGVIVGRGTGGPANIRTDLEGSRDSILAAVHEALRDAGVDAAVLARTPALLGLAGSNVGPYRDGIAALLPFPHAAVETDAAIALEGAVGAGDGAIGIIGTGTAYLARRAGTLREIGGWGFLLGDQGGGARIGRDLLEETLLVHDGILPPSALAERVMRRFGEPQQIVEFTREAKPADFAAFAPWVFEQQRDGLAARILGRAAAAVEASLNALPVAPEAPLCLLGGLAPLIEPRLAAGIRARLSAPKQDALGGAVAMAARRFGQKSREVAHG